ncbi:MAG TPA: iron uptake transporter deferrochelatase/peroxidase subunit [Actinomycetales bacterium]|jgi:deferrochelatase/peroxidase EfeB
MTAPDLPRDPDAAPAAGLSRRRLFGLGAAAAVVGATTAQGVAAAEGSKAIAPASAAANRVAFHGDHQAGISTPVQDRLHIAAFDLTTDDRDALIALLRRWTVAAAELTAGRELGSGALPAVVEAPPDDTGEALGLSGSRLTLTFGFGPGVFEKDGVDRFGLRSQRPAALVDLPHFSGDVLDPARCGGDLVVQACADDPQVAVHAIRNLARLAFGDASVRWSQLGFGKTSSTTPAAQTPRNLFGFKDGTSNIASDDQAELRQHVWADAADGAAWMHGGSYLVARRIAMTIETWDRTSLLEQEQVTGRHKGTGAPLGKKAEHDVVEVKRLPKASHVALAHPDTNDGHKILRRGYSYVDGSDGLGHLDSGLFFIAFCRDPRTQYVPMQRKLSTIDLMAEYLRHTGSGLWAVPPGVAPGGYWGQSLLEA